MKQEANGHCPWTEDEESVWSVLSLSLHLTGPSKPRGQGVRSQHPGKTPHLWRPPRGRDDPSEAGWGQWSMGPSPTAVTSAPGTTLRRSWDPEIQPVRTSSFLSWMASSWEVWFDPMYSKMESPQVVKCALILCTVRWRAHRWGSVIWSYV